MPEGPQYQFDLARDSKNRLEALICSDVKACIKLLAIDHPRRTENNTHAYVILEFSTELGAFVRRDILIQKSKSTQTFFLRYSQFKTGHIRGDKEEWLDTFGPLKQKTREVVQERVLALFEEIQLRADNGDLPLAVPSTRDRPNQKSGGKTRRSFQETTPGSMGDRPEVAAELTRLRVAMEESKALASGVSQVDQGSQEELDLTSTEG